MARLAPVQCQVITLAAAVAVLWVACALAGVAKGGGGTTSTRLHQAPWMTFYGPLRLGDNAEDDIRTMSALATWLRLDFSPAKSAVAKKPRSWPALSPTPPDIMLFTDDDGRSCGLLTRALRDIIDHSQPRLRVKCLTTCGGHGKKGLQHLDMACIVRRGLALATTPVVTLINSDIALGADFVRAVSSVFFPGLLNALVIGQRTDLAFDAVTKAALVMNGHGTNGNDTYGSFASRVQLWAAIHGRRHGGYGIDYMTTLREGFWKQSPIQQEMAVQVTLDDGFDGEDANNVDPGVVFMPPFYTGVYRWDSYVVAAALMSSKVVVIDATDAVTAVHLQAPSGPNATTTHRRRRGAVYNDRLVNSLMGKQYLAGRTQNADYKLTADGRLVVGVDNLV